MFGFMGEGRDELLIFVILIIIIRRRRIVIIRIIKIIKIYRIITRIIGLCGCKAGTKICKSPLSFERRRE